MKNDQVVAFINALDGLSSEYCIHIDSKYESQINLVDDQGNVLASQFHLIEGLGYDCYES
jgi:hypothetical protein